MSAATSGGNPRISLRSCGLLANPQGAKPHNTNLRFATQSTHVHRPVSGNKLVGTKLQVQFKLAGGRKGVTYISSSWLCWAFQHLRGAFDVSITVVHSIALR